MPRLRTTALAALLAVAVIGGCGSDSDDDTAAADGGSTAAATCEPGTGTTVTVEIPEFRFDPTPVEVDRCDSVVWRNAHDQAHTSTGEGAMSWSTGNIAPGEAAAEPVQFASAGTFSYICALHPFMKGTVTVAG